MKLGFIVIELAIVVVFAAAGYTGHSNIAAILEWTIAFIFTLYLFSFLIDLIPAVKTRAQDKNGSNVSHYETEMQLEMN